MAITITNIVTRVQRRVIDLPAAITAETETLVNDAMRLVQEKHNFRVMEAEVQATTANQTRKLADVPIDWKEKRDKPFTRDGNNGTLGTTEMAWGVTRTDLLKDFDFEANTSATGGSPDVILEAVWAIDNDIPGELQVYPLPDANSLWSDGNYRVVMPYWRYLPALTAGQANWFTRNAEKYLLNQAVAEAHWLNWDEQRASLWEAKAQAELIPLIRADKRSKITRTDTFTPRRDVNASVRQLRSR